ncbi:hypothetical protein [Neobacillus citreus]|uniref:Uncharacterized protein n=1 Tax=Neobacillus citreus TaxID=2833578 RepID=A0A942T2U6_9BACI|nr:hypothetical protein [Neobacillus citreus]MCH6267816.1 hypothetical protein [Neobacillus citreus]
MKKLFLSIFALAFIFAFDIRALANEGHSHDQSIKQAAEKFKNGSSADSSSGHSEMENHDDGASKGKENSHTEAGMHDDMDMEGIQSDMNMEGSHTESGHEEGSGDHHGPVVEIPPNYKVLGTYGAVNLSFIFIGIWNKWFRRKGI